MPSARGWCASVPSLFTVAAPAPPAPAGPGGAGGEAENLTKMSKTSLPFRNTFAAHPRGCKELPPRKHHLECCSDSVSSSSVSTAPSVLQPIVDISAVAPARRLLRRQTACARSSPIRLRRLQPWQTRRTTHSRRSLLERAMLGKVHCCRRVRVRVLAWLEHARLFSRTAEAAALAARELAAGAVRSASAARPQLHVSVRPLVPPAARAALCEWPPE